MLRRYNRRIASQKQSWRPHRKKSLDRPRRRASAQGLVRVEVKADKADAGLPRTLAETLRSDPDRARSLRSLLEQALIDPQVKTSSVQTFLTRVSPASSANRARRTGVRSTSEVPARHQRHLRNRKRDRAHPSVADWVARTPVKEMGTSVVILAETRRGIELRRRHDTEQAASSDRWFAQMLTRLGDRVLSIDEPIAEALGAPDRPRPAADHRRMARRNRKSAWFDARYPKHGRRHANRRSAFGPV
jgi:hypothetical protein